jgi:hypothetical protein
LRGYGNAIVPELAAVFVKAFDEIHTANDKGQPTAGDKSPTNQENA